MGDTQAQTILQIRTVKNLNVEVIAEAANVPVEDVYYLEAGISYPKAIIEQVLAALSRLTGEKYTRDNVMGIYSIEEETHG